MLKKRKKDDAAHWQHFVDLSGASGRLSLGKGSLPPRDGDEVLAINGATLAAKSHAQAVQIIRDCQPPLCLELRRAAPRANVVEPRRRVSRLLAAGAEDLYDNVDVKQVVHLRRGSSGLLQPTALQQERPIDIQGEPNNDEATAAQARRKSSSFHGLPSRGMGAAGLSVAATTEGRPCPADAHRNQLRGTALLDRDSPANVEQDATSASGMAAASRRDKDGRPMPPVPPRRLDQLGRSASDSGEHLYLAPRQAHCRIEDEVSHVMAPVCPPSLARPRPQPLPLKASATTSRQTEPPSRNLESASLSWHASGAGQLVLKGTGISAGLARAVARSLLELGLLESSTSAFRAAEQRNSHTFHLSAPKLTGTPPLLSLALSRTCRALLAHGFQARPQKSRENPHRIHLSRPAGQSGESFLLDGMKRYACEGCVSGCASAEGVTTLTGCELDY